ncbi:hypothetical protein PQO03_11795 [Lentisphaera profundi]|uniref:Uncharacterized protein n=1 Tax=Lentisphaera profundi TaxID=1658616 RepID=A0ABY7VX75_9BACT|nr:hypothetical protein [Lentisphaera profundi]WDE98521.1 hypothetical protein PQO03_11795 [Lentisphaera profundi]
MGYYTHLMLDKSDADYNKRLAEVFNDDKAAMKRHDLNIMIVEVEKMVTTLNLKLAELNNSDENKTMLNSELLKLVEFLEEAQVEIT